MRQRRLKREQYALDIAKTGRVVNQSLGRRRVDEQLRVDSLLAAAGRVITMADRAIREHEERSAAAALAAEMAPVASAAEMAVRVEVEAEVGVGVEVEAEEEAEVEVEPPPAHPAAAVSEAPPALQEPVLPVMLPQVVLRWPAPPAAVVSEAPPALQELPPVMLPQALLGWTLPHHLTLQIGGGVRHQRKLRFRELRFRQWAAIYAARREKLRALYWPKGAC